MRPHLLLCALGAVACTQDFDALFRGDASSSDGPAATSDASSDAKIVEASCAPNATCNGTCDKTPACGFACSGCTTDYHCQGAATSCAVDCEEGSTCKVTCDFAGPCTVRCASGSQCLLSCTPKVPDGGCTMDCAGGAPTTCPAPGASKAFACNRACN